MSPMQSGICFSYTPEEHGILAITQDRGTVNNNITNHLSPTQTKQSL